MRSALFSIELWALVKATVLLATGILVALASGRARASMRHLLLASTFAAVLALPLIVITAPGVAIEVPLPAVRDAVIVSTAAPVISASASAAQAPSTRSQISWQAVLRLVWMAGILLFAGRLVLDLTRLRSI